MLLQKFKTNDKGRDFVVGDIHGHPKKLLECLEKAEFDKTTDRVFSAGDLVDRGPDSMGALAFLKEPWFHAVKGNHEDMMIQATLLGNEYFPLWVMNGGNWHIDESPLELRKWAEFLQKLPLVIVIGEGAERVNIYHAEAYFDDKAIDAQQYTYRQVQGLLWGRSIIQNFKQSGVCKIEGLSQTYVGHSTVRGVTHAGPLTYIDTGCGFKNGRLSMLDIRSKQIYQSEPV